MGNIRYGSDLPSLFCFQSKDILCNKLIKLPQNGNTLKCYTNSPLFVSRFCAVDVIFCAVDAPWLSIVTELSWE